MLKRNTKFDHLIACVSDRLVAEGFKRKGPTFTCLSDLNLLLVQVQKSTSSTSETTRLTVNLGVVCGPLLPPRRDELKKSTFEDCHLRLRIGDLLPSQPDKWWDLSSEADVQRACLELNTLLVEKGLPYLRKFLTPESLLRMWETGESAGITEFRRLKYIHQLRTSL